MRYAAPLFVLGILLAACGGGGPGGTPQETFDAMKSAMESEDWGTIFDIMSPDRRKELENELKGDEEDVGAMIGKSAEDVKSMSVREVFVEVMAKFVEMDRSKIDQAKKAEFVEEKIDGDHATVKIKVGDDEDTVRMVKVDGKWYLDEEFGM